MNVLALLRQRLSLALNSLTESAGDLVDQVRPSQDPKFGDYQINAAMPLAKRLARPPREVAAQLAAALDLADLCHPPEVAGPGFINLKLRDDWLAEQVRRAAADPERLGIPPVAAARTYVVDYSSPNVAKPMHVGHIRSTVIGDALYRVLRFLGHRVISDNHVGDWGTQFGMILFGYKHFLDAAAYAARPVDELARLYRLVNRLVEYHEARTELPAWEARLAKAEAALAEHRAAAVPLDKAAARKHQETGRDLARHRDDAAETVRSLADRITSLERDPPLAKLAHEHPQIGRQVLAETARLHAGDPENRRLWAEFLPPCLRVIEDTVYRRLGVRFDYTLGESFYHDRLAGVVESLQARGIAQAGEGGACVIFDPQWPSPLLIQKQDGAYLYATTDLATVQYRMQTWQPDVILYVVDHRQSLHFQQFFAAARRWGYDRTEFVHVSFGTVMGEDGKPFKTRAGDTVGLVALLDEAVHRAHDLVSRKDDEQPDGPQLDAAQRARTAEIVGIGALKYADLSQNRTTDYVFSYEKMLALDGNTAAYMQYMYARVRSIFRKGNVDAAALRSAVPQVRLETAAERNLAGQLLRFEEALAAVLADYRPNQLTTYLYDLAYAYAGFFDGCPVLKAETPQQRASRLVLCDLTARTIQKGLELLGIGVVERM